MEIAAAEFKAKCLAILDQVHESGESVTITKRGKVVARLVPAGEAERPWRRLERTAEWHGDPLAPAVAESDIESLR